MHNIKSNTRKIILSSILALGITGTMTTNVFATMVYDDGSNTSTNYIEHNVNQVNNKLDDATYVQDNLNMISEIESKRQAVKSIDESKEGMKKEVLSEKFEEKMKELQRKKEEEMKRLSSNSDADERAKRMGMKLGSIGDTSVKLDLDIIYKIIEKNKSNYTDTQVAIIKNLPKYLGKSYVWGASGPDGYDCSGFTSSIMSDVGFKTPRTASDQYTSSQNKIEIEDLTLGDLVFFKNTGGRSGITHVGMYIGDGLMVHASSTYDAIKTENVFGGYFSGKYVGAARYFK